VKSNFPNCLGAVDDKHVAIVPQPGAVSYFFNYKSYNSQVLIGIADSNYEFTSVLLPMVVYLTEVS
jgi:hypothetical protein